MRCEAMQMDRMAVYERYGAYAGETARVMEDIRRRMRREAKAMEDELNESVSDQCAD